VTTGDRSWFATHDSRVVHEGFSTVRIDTVGLPGGDQATREVVEHDDAVAIVPVTDDGDVLLLRQYRHPLGGYILEVPAGTLDVDGEEPEACARRELREEVQHDAATWRWLTTFHNSAGWSTERTHVYLATGLRVGQPPDDFEPEAEEADMEVVALPFPVVLEMVRDGSLTDAKTVVGILLADPHVI
jgi:8-oxo-dGDP phosphatase